MQQQINAVRAFHEKMNATIRTRWTAYSAFMGLARMPFIYSEVVELHEALMAQDRVKALDALADILYVVFGIALASGLADLLPEAFERVHVSNMTKTPADDGKAIKGLDFVPAELETLFEGSYDDK